MIIYTKAEIKKQLERLSREKDAIHLTDWERGFIEDVELKPFISLSEKQLQKISDIYLEKCE